MKVKRYVVNALPEALPMIRSELGVDAVILNTKEIRIGGFLGMFGKKKMEVIAAVESNSIQAARPAPRVAAPSSSSISPEDAATMAATLSAAAALRDKLPVQSARQEEPVKRPAELEPVHTGAAPGAIYAARTGTVQSPPLVTTDYANASVTPVQSASPQAAPASAPVAATASQNSLLSEVELMDEIRDMKQWIMRMSRQQQLKTRPPAIQALYDRLLQQELSQQWIDQLLTAVEEQIDYLNITQGQQEPDHALVWKLAGQTLMVWLRDFEYDKIGKDTRVIHFVGPTGVGKTTSIAKLAAEQTLKAGRKVGFITSDTYRIAAVDQLRTYATILNVPLEVVFSPSEVTRAFKMLDDRELIFMDTAGRNFRNELYVSEVNSLLQMNDCSETFLVLSLTGKYSDMSSVAGNFAKFGINRVLYTKQDETDALGSILNLALEHGMKPTYVAYGQTVPDDIAQFQSSVYVAQLLGDTHE